MLLQSKNDILPFCSNKESCDIPAMKPRKRVGKYILLKTLGRGSMGKVKLAINIETNKEVAVKIVSRTVNSKAKNTTEISREIRTIRESSMMTLLDHPFIASVQEMVLMDDYYYLFMEYVDGGQLLDYVISHGRLKEKHARLFSRQIASALDYCHRNSIVHRDLKVENILISKNGNIKIIDFGLSNLFSPRSHLSTFCGSLYFAAPELLKGKLYTGPEIDVWSFGVVIYVLVCGKVPFDDSTVGGLHGKVRNGFVDYPSHLSSDLKDMLRRMLVSDPIKRASMSEIIVHPWMMKGFQSPVENYVQKRKPLQLPLDMNVIQGMQGFEFGTTDQILKELQDLISNEEYQTAAKNLEILSNYTYNKHSNSRSPFKSKSFLSATDDPQSIPAAYHPLISIYHLVKERMDNTKSLSTKSVNRLSPPVGFSYTANGKSNIHDTIEHHFINSELSPRSSLEVETISAPKSNVGSLGKKLNRLLRRTTTVTRKKDIRGDANYRNSVPNNNPKNTYCRESDISTTSSKPTASSNQFVGHAHPIYLKGLFSVLTTSTKKASDIRYEIIRVLIQKSDIEYRENKDRFECCMSIDAHTGIDFFSEKEDESTRRMDPFAVRFDIYIVKIPWLLGIRGIQFRRISGDTWQYKNTCTRILQDLRL
ncbi:kinase-like domain-containing protein [Thamnidium elegans]|nr:kinase-like domain-containing protein [Thamnidium elegans]